MTGPLIILKGRPRYLYHLRFPFLFFKRIKKTFFILLVAWLRLQKILVIFYAFPKTNFTQLLFSHTFCFLHNYLAYFSWNSRFNFFMEQGVIHLFKQVSIFSSYCLSFLELLSYFFHKNKVLQNFILFFVLTSMYHLLQIP